MLCWITILGGALIMMGQHSRSEALFYYFRLEDQVPENHLLRLIEKHISFAFVRERLKDTYSETGRPSIDPELLLRILLMGYSKGDAGTAFAERARMLIKRGYTPKVAVELVLHEMEFEEGNNSRMIEKAVLMPRISFWESARASSEVGLSR